MRATTIGIAAVLWTGCSNKLSSDLDLNGEKVTLTSCRNGLVYGFRGIELTAESGIRLRIAATPTGDADVVVMPSGSAKGERLGSCGTFELADQNSEINKVKNVEGRATFDCKVAGYALKGSASFGNCH
jgi:hypothetical protein